MKKRYISFQATKNIPKNLLYAFLRQGFFSFFGELGCSKLKYKIIEYNETNGEGIILVNREMFEDVLAFLAIEQKDFRIVAKKSSGTLKALRNPC